MTLYSVKLLDAFLSISFRFRPSIHLTNKRYFTNVHSGASILHSSFGQGNFEPTMMDDADDDTDGDNVFVSNLKPQSQREAVASSKDKEIDDELSLEAMLSQSLKEQQQREELAKRKKVIAKREAVKKKSDKEYEKYWEKKNSKVIDYLEGNKKKNTGALYNNYYSLTRNQSLQEKLSNNNNLQNKQQQSSNVQKSSTVMVKDSLNNVVKSVKSDRNDSEDELKWNDVNVQPVRAGEVMKTGVAIISLFLLLVVIKSTLE